MSRSRTGCSKCKRRRIKCDETKPICTQCRVRGDIEGCDVGGGMVIYSADAPSRSSRDTSAPQQDFSSYATQQSQPGLGTGTQAESSASQAGSVARLQAYWNAEPGQSREQRNTRRSSISSLSQADIFHMLPIEAPDPHAQDLLHRFFTGISEGRVGQSAAAPYVPPDLDLSQILEDKGSCHALLAYLETDLMGGGYRSSRQNETRFYHIHTLGAISELRRALANPGQYMSIASIMRTVLNLGWAAHMVDDPRSAEIHVSGMATLISQHFDEWWDHPTGSKVRIGPAGTRLSSLCADRKKGRFVHLRNPKFFRQAASRADANESGKNRSRALKLPEYLTPSSHRSDADMSGLVITGFRSASERGLICDELLWLTPNLLELEQLLLAAHTRREQFDPAKARDYLCHLYLNGWSLSLYEPLVPIAAFWHHSLTLYFYRMAFSRPEIIPERCAASLLEVLNYEEGVFRMTSRQNDAPELDVDNVSTVFRSIAGAFPSALLWIALLAGPVADERLRQWYCSLLRWVCLNTDPPLTNLDDALSRQIKPHWLWSDRLTPSARRIWEDAFGGGVDP